MGTRARLVLRGREYDRGMDEASLEKKLGHYRLTR
jgi:hypothetical protein